MPREPLHGVLRRGRVTARAARDVPFHLIRGAGCYQPRDSRGLAGRRRFGAKRKLFPALLVLFCLRPLLAQPGPSAETLPGRTAGCSPGNGQLPSGLLVTNEVPRAFTTQSLREALLRLLTAQEMSKVVDPLASTPEMQRWASNAVPATANDLQKAERLCELLSTRKPPGPPIYGPPIYGPPIYEGAYRTASATFSVWGDPGQGLNCTDLAYFYVSLARVLGVRAFCVNVEKDCYGTARRHTCAAVFAAGQAVLADPAYRTFGIAHQKFVVLDDLQATGLFLSGVEDLETCQIAAKLAPNLLIVQSALFRKIDQAGRRAEADQCLAVMEKLNPDASITVYAAARLAVWSGRLDQAAALVRKAIQAEPEWPGYRTTLGDIYNSMGNVKEALQCYQAAASYRREGEMREHCDEMIARIRSNLVVQADSQFAPLSKGTLPKGQRPDVNRAPELGWRVLVVLLLALTFGVLAASVAHGRRQRRS